MIRKSLSVVGAAAILLLGAASVSAQEQYSVVRGDTLYGISKRYGISLHQLTQANSISGTLIHPGQILVIPGYQSSTPSYTQDYNHSGTTTRPYEPYTGTSSSSASSVQPTSYSQANQANNYGGQAQTYQASNQNYQVHTVQHGDTLWAISQRYGQSVTALKQANSLDSDLLRCGQQLYIPTVVANQYPAATCNAGICNINAQRPVTPPVSSYGY